MRIVLLSLLGCLALSACQPGAEAPVLTVATDTVETTAENAEKLQVKAVVVAMFELGEDEGDRPRRIPILEGTLRPDRKISLPSRLPRPLLQP